MTRQFLIRILLSLLLLASQQMAAAHAIAHWHGALGGSAVVHAEGELSKAFAEADACDQCLALAQLAGMLGSTPRAFAVPDLVASSVAEAAARAASRRTVCVFQPRGPPQA